MPPAKETVDVSGMHLLPGAIDVHVHFRDPGYPHKEDFASGTIAAALGGMTTVFDMPNTIPTVSTPEALAAKLKMAAEKAHVDFGLYAVLGEDSIEHAGARCDRRDRLQALHGQHVRQDPVAVDRRACWKRSRSSRRPASASRCMPRPTRSWSGARAASATPAAPSRWRISPRDRPWSPSRRSAAPRSSPEWTGARIHVLHISSADELRPLADAKARGVDITGETCPATSSSPAATTRGSPASSASIRPCARSATRTDLGGAADGTSD